MCTLSVVLDRDHFVCVCVCDIHTLSLGAHCGSRIFRYPVYDLIKTFVLLVMFLHSDHSVLCGLLWCSHMCMLGVAFFACTSFVAVLPHNTGDYTIAATGVPNSRAVGTLLNSCKLHLGFNSTVSGLQGSYFCN